MITYEQKKQIIKNGQDALSLVSSNIPQVEFRLVFGRQSDYDVYCSDTGTLLGYMTGDIHKDTAMVTLRWFPSQAKRNFAPKRFFKYDPINGEGTEDRFVAWITGVIIDLGIIPIQ